MNKGYSLKKEGIYLKDIPCTIKEYPKGISFVKNRDISCQSRKPYKGGFGRGWLCWYPPEKKGLFWGKGGRDER